MKKKEFYLTLMALSLSLLSPSCTKEGGEATPGGSVEHPEEPVNPPASDEWEFDEDKAETLVFTQAEAQYIGDDIGEGASDHWIVTLTGAAGGEELVLELNAAFNEKQEADLSLLNASYRTQSSASDYSAGTFGPGESYRLDAPNEPQYVPQGTWLRLGEKGSIDYLYMGSIEVGETGISGILVGDMFRKRNFRYEGTIDIVPIQTHRVPNSTIGSDVAFDSSHFTSVSVEDLGDSFVAGTGTYKAFKVKATSGNVKLNRKGYDYYFDGTGDFVQIYLFVSPDASVAAVPEGEYTAVELGEHGGPIKGDLLPFRYWPGMPDQFSDFTGSWYISVKDGKWDKYARLAGGSVKVSVGTDGKRALTFDMTDCNEPANKVSGNIETFKTL